MGGAMSRTIEIPVSDEMLHRLDEKARQSGLKREEYVAALLSTALAGPPTLTEILAPFRAQIIASGASDDELAKIFERSTGRSLPGKASLEN